MASSSSSSTPRPCPSVPRSYIITPTAKAAPKNDDIQKSFPSLKGKSFSITGAGDKVVSDYSELFPNVKFDCYYTIYPWIASVNPEAWKMIDSYLPTSGPIVATDLGLMLSYFVFTFGLKGIKVPRVVEAEICGYKFLHFCTSRLIRVEELISVLLIFDGFVGAGGGVNPDNMMMNVASTK